MLIYTAHITDILFFQGTLTKSPNQPMAYSQVFGQHTEMVPGSKQATASDKQILGLNCGILGKRRRHTPRKTFRQTDGCCSEGDTPKPDSLEISVLHQTSCRDKPSNRKDALGDKKETVSDKQTSKCDATVGSFLKNQKRKVISSSSRGENPRKILRRTDGYSSEGETPKPGSLEIAVQAQPRSRDLSRRDERENASGCIGATVRV